MTFAVKDPPMLIRRPDQEYHKATGDKLTMPCEAKGTPYPKKTWRRVSHFLSFIVNQLSLNFHVLACSYPLTEN